MSLRDNIETLTDAALSHRESGEAMLAAQDATCVAYFVASIANVLLVRELRARLESEPDGGPPKPGEPA